MPAGRLRSRAKGERINIRDRNSAPHRSTPQGDTAASKSPTDKVAAVLALPPLFLRLDRRVRQPPLL
jgi:hypothetical protein